MTNVAADRQGPQWSGRAGFVLAAVGSAVGLGNLLRFPYVAGESGGGAFVLFYLLCIVFIGLPVLMAELLIGRRGGGSAIAAMARLARAEGRTALWGLAGALGALGSFLILSFYSVLAGWVLHFLIVAVTDYAEGLLAGGGPAASAYPGMVPDGVTSQLGDLLAEPVRMVVLNGIFLALTVGVVARGVKSGIERAAVTLMPVLFLLLLILLIYALTEGSAGPAISFLFAPDFGNFFAILKDGSILLQAIGQAFFSLSLGAAMMITYGLYLGRDDDLAGSAGIIAAADTGVALIAGLAIFPVVFAAQLPEAQGLALLFNTLPLAFHEMPFGGLFAIAFFLMVLFAALTSAIALLEVVVAAGEAALNRSGRSARAIRPIVAIVVGVLVFGLGIGNVLSQSAAEPNFFTSWYPLGRITLFAGMPLLDTIDKLTAEIILPTCGFLTAIFAGWVLSSTAVREELNLPSERAFRRWRFLCRWVAPLAIGAVLIYAVVIVPLLG